MDPGLGSRLPELLQTRGAEPARVELRPHAERGGTPLAQMMNLSTQQLAEKYIATGCASAADLAGYCEFSSDPKCWGVYYTTVSISAQF